MHNSIDKQHCNSHKTIIIIILIPTVIITITTVINFNRYLLKRLNTLFEKLLVLRFTTYYKIRQGVVTTYDSSYCYTSRQHVITIDDRCVITIHDTYYISRQVLQYTTSVITIHDRFYNSRHYYISRQYRRRLFKNEFIFYQWTAKPNVQRFIMHGQS